VLPVIATAAAHLPCLAGLGYEGEATTLRIPIKQSAGGRLADDQKTVNLIHAHRRSQAERANSLLKTTFAAALVLLHHEHGRTT
jgi:hypothetical protein